MSETISTSVSAAAIFSADESWGRPPKRKDMIAARVDRYLEMVTGLWTGSAAGSMMRVFEALVI